MDSGFHSIGFPSEWGAGAVVETIQEDAYEVSIQLVSPASGEIINFQKGQKVIVDLVSIQLVSPASGEVNQAMLDETMSSGFPFNWFPQRVGRVHAKQPQRANHLCFHSIGFPSEWGIES